MRSTRSPGTSAARTWPFRWSASTRWRAIQGTSELGSAPGPGAWGAGNLLWRGGGGGGSPAMPGGRQEGSRPGGIQRVGLSATVRPPEVVAAFLGGARPVTVVQPPSAKQIELEVIVPVEDMSDLETAQGLRTGPDGEPADDPVARRSIWPHVEERV